MLNGTKKQVEWADDIRTEMLEHIAESRQEFEDQVKKAKEAGKDTTGSEKIRKVFDQAQNIVESQSEAKWFIDNRHLVIHPRQTVKNIVGM